MCPIMARDDNPNRRSLITHLRSYSPPQGSTFVSMIGPQQFTHASQALSRLKPVKLLTCRECAVA